MTRTPETHDGARAPEPISGGLVQPAQRWRATERWLAPVLASASAVAGLFWVGTALHANSGFPLDDSWIHQEIARNLAHFHSFGFTPMKTSSGSSSLLWTLLLSLNYLVFPKVSPVTYALILNSALLIGSSLLLCSMAKRDQLPLPELLALSTLPGLSGNWVWLAFTGMEHVLFVTLSLVAIMLWFRSQRGAYWTGLALGCLALCRPEGAALCGLLFVCFRVCGRKLRDVVVAALVAAAIFLPSLELNRLASGALLPSTMQGRRFLYFGATQVHPGAASFTKLALETYRVVLAHNFFSLKGRWIPAFVLLALFGLYALLRRFPCRTSLLFAWAIVDYLAYAAVLPTPGHAGRYQPFILFLFAPLMVTGGIVLLRLLATRATLIGEPSSERLCLGVVLIAAVLTAITLPRWRRVLSDGIADINGCHRQIAEWMNEHLPSGTNVGAFDIGALGYFSDVHVIDLGGLVDPKFLPYLLRGTVPEYMRQNNVAYVMLPHDADNMRFADELHLLHNPAVRLQPIITMRIDPATWKEAFDCTQNALWMQTLYRVTYASSNVTSPTTKNRGSSRNGE